jgi:predicted ATPase/DNA-binding SARP family transcriptional activator
LINRAQFRILGAVQALVDGRPAALGAPKQRALLAVLLLHEGAVVSRDRLVDAIWGADPPASAIQSLQVYVHGLRRALGADRIQTEGAGYRIRLEDAELDLERFERLVEQGRRALEAGDPEDAADELRGALGLWRGSALGDLLPESPLAAEAGRIEELRLAALELRNEAELACGRHDTLIAELEALVAEHPYREPFREQQILALYRAGRQKEALAAFREARQTFAAELGIEPGRRLQDLERAILRHDPALAAPAPRARAALRLPAPPTPLIGRQLEIAAVAALLREEGARLVTLTGPGGTGKTRLALAVAEALAPEVRDGVVFVDLAAVSDADLLASAIAEALGIPEDEGPPVRSVAGHLRTKRLLLVLDNLEQLLPASPVVAELLSAAPRLLVLATSRAALRLAAEHEYPVPPFAPPDEGLPFEELVRGDAVRLFAARARAVDVSFQLTEENAPSVAHICRRLDGLPLAIELAAARTRLLPPRAMSERLDRALDVLVGGPRDVPLRQRTLRATLDWSHEALAEGERALFARLAAFAGGCTLEAADAVCSEDGGDVLEPLSVLVDVNLVRSSPGIDGRPRFTLLETIREYALERLAETGDEDRVRERHCRYLVAWAEQAYETLVSGGAGEAVYATLDVEHDNFRAALAWTAHAGEVELEVRLSVALRQFWIVRGHLAEGRRYFSRAVADTVEAGPRLRADALLHGAQFPYRQGDLAEAKAWWGEALDLLRELGDAAGIARCAAELGAVAYSEGDLDRSAQLYDEARTRFRELGDEMRFAICAGNVAEIAIMQGDLEAAVRHGEEAAAIQRKLGEEDGLAMSLHGLARARQQLGDLDGARRLFAECLVTARGLGFREAIANCVEGAAEVTLADGDPEQAARLYLVARRSLDDTGAQLQGPEAEGYARTAVALRERLGAVDLAAIEQRTSSLQLEDVVEEAIAALQH